MVLSSSQCIGPYEIVSPLGAGGLGGEVYRARDTKPKREVALKILPAHVSQDVERLARFKRFQMEPKSDHSFVTARAETIANPLSAAPMAGVSHGTAVLNWPL